MSKRSKYDKLFAVFESLCAQLAVVPDDNARGLIGSWGKAKFNTLNGCLIHRRESQDRKLLPDWSRAYLKLRGGFNESDLSGEIKLWQHYRRRLKSNFPSLVPSNETLFLRS